MQSDVRKIKLTTDLQRTKLKAAWLDRLDGSEHDRPHFWSQNPRQLNTISSISPGTFIVGNGAAIYESTLLPALETAEHEIIFVTCFWARSKCLDQLCAVLIKLSERQNTRPNGTPRLRVRLCFSSRSLMQKLFHTSSASGYVYPSSEWVSRLGLPSPEILSGLDLQIKSVFFLPFSVMHPKFVVIDCKRALMPSCNLSYESWLEGCLPLTGPAVDSLVQFWYETWGQGDLSVVPSNTANAEGTPQVSLPSHPITLLPSPHHCSPRFRPLFSIPSPPATPLNCYLEGIISTAKSSIIILTPNLTSQPVILWLLASLARGVDVTIITNRRMMVLEQLLTAGTLTEICVWRLKRRYQNLVSARRKSISRDELLEEGRGRTGSLSIGYFRSSARYARSHVKCTIVDEEIMVLGSGNLDRASWYTSQELGVAIEGENVVREVWGKIEEELDEGGMGGVEWV